MNKIQKIRLFFYLKLFSNKLVKTPRGKKVFTSLWHAAWLEKKYAEKNEPIIKKYEKYDRFSTDLLVNFLWFFPIGTMRIIQNNEEIGLPVLNDFRIKKVWENDTRISEVTLLTVKKRFRNTLNIPLFFLMKGLYRISKERKNEGLLVAADKRLLFVLKRIGLPFEAIGPGVFYEGSITIPAYMSFSGLEEKISRKNPWFARFLSIKKSR